MMRRKRKKPTKKEAWVNEYHQKIGIDRELLLGVYEDLQKKKRRKSA